MNYLPVIKNRLYCALDESNHDREKEIFVFAFSTSPEHAKISLTFESVRLRREGIEASVPKLLGALDYRFCVVSREHYQRIGSHNIPREVTLSFLRALDYSPEALEIFIDGGLSSVQRGALKKGVRKVIPIPYPAIGVHSVAKTRNCEGQVKLHEARPRGI